jgi:hypothetical protein
VTASEFALLALGLVLGVSTGAALVEVLRARPPSRPEVRVTVSPNAIPAKRSSTLADPAGSDGSYGPARGGPADRRWVDRDLDDDLPPGSDPAPPLAAGIGSASGPMSGNQLRTPVPSAADPPPLRLAGASGAGSIALIGSVRPMARIPVASEPDPMMAALQAATVGATTGATTEATTAATTAARSVGGAAIAERAQPPTEMAPLSEASSRPRSAAKGTPRTSAKGAVAPDASRGPAGGGDGTDACAEERRVADERCAVAVRARDGARAAMETLRSAQREYDDHVIRAESDTAMADPRGVRAAKESAHQAFRQARSSARSREAVESAAREWLTEINRINQATRDAASQAERNRAAATAMAHTLERLSVEADAARISAESADEACVAAREAVAACQEVATLAAAAARAAMPGTPSATDPAGAQLAAEAGSTESRAGNDAAIIRLLRGDHEVLGRIVAKLAGDDEAERRRWQLAIGRLLEALVARAMEASAFDFPTNHPFWGAFTQSQCRDIVAALASLGYRHDGFGGWADDRVPGQRDLSLAVGYAGLDPMRIRHWPSEAESKRLMADVTVAADEYLWEAAGTLTLGELISMLGRRADGLLDLWNDWGVVRPLLMSDE